MKKLDLHIHTIATVSDSDFEFSLEQLQDYISAMAIDCIAITNHNLFDKDQFDTISSSLSIDVLPGIEIDLEGGHILLISDGNAIDDFAGKCDQIHQQIPTRSDCISVDTLRSIFSDLSKYIIIPHYDKKPIVRQEVIEKLREYISSGEVTSVRKFKASLKEPESLVPVIFSDFRPQIGASVFPIRQTFFDLEEITFAGIKTCLSDKAKVYLSKDDGNNLFQATDDGIKLSTGLNVIFGERSTGKTHTLEKICQAFDNVKYIKQFSLLQNDEGKFEELMSIRNSTVSESFLYEFRKVVEDVSTIDLKQNEIDANKYLTSLIKFANESDKADSYSKVILFGETPFEQTKQNSLKNLIDAVTLLIDNVEYKDLINDFVSIGSLRELVIGLMNRFIAVHEQNLKKQWVNELTKKIQQELRFKTNTPHPEDIDFYKIVIEKEKVEKFENIVSRMKVTREVDRKEIRGFKIVASTRPYSGALQLKDKSGRKLAFNGAFKHYEAPYRFLQCLKDLELAETEYYKYFIDFDYKTLNKHGFPVSGGERSEFNLLHEISDALKFDLLLLDEPESSFDNLFLKNEVNELIKDIAKAIPVIVVTHNSTVGASIKPDYILYTERFLANNDVEYRIYSGHPSSKILTSAAGKTISNFEVMLNCLEAGSDTYNERRLRSYEVLKNQ